MTLFSGPNSVTLSGKHCSGVAGGRTFELQGPDSGAKILALKSALKLALKMALDFLHWKKSENG